MNIYNALIELMSNAFYGITDLTLLTGWQEMTLTVLATIGVVFVFALPFIIVWKIISYFFVR